MIARGGYNNSTRTFYKSFFGSSLHVSLPAIHLNVKKNKVAFILRETICQPTYLPTSASALFAYSLLTVYGIYSVGGACCPCN